MNQSIGTTPEEIVKSLFRTLLAPKHDINGRYLNNLSTHVYNSLLLAHADLIGVIIVNELSYKQQTIN